MELACRTHSPRPVSIGCLMIAQTRRTSSGSLSGDRSRQHTRRCSIGGHDWQRSKEELDASPRRLVQTRHLFCDQNTVAQKGSVNRPVKIRRSKLGRKIGGLGINSDSRSTTLLKPLKTSSARCNSTRSHASVSWAGGRGVYLTVVALALFLAPGFLRVFLPFPADFDWWNRVLALPVFNLASYASVAP